MPLSPFDTPQATLLFAAAAAWCAVVWLLRRRARHLILPSVEPLSALRKERAPRTLRSVATLLCQIALAGLVARALWKAEDSAPASPTADTTTVVIDRSASMRGRLEAAESWAASHGDHILHTDGADGALADDAIGLGDTVALAKQLGQHVTVVSDHLDTHDPDVTWQVVGPPADDIGIDDLSVRLSHGLPAELLVTVSVDNHKASSAALQLALTTDQGLLGTHPVELAAHERRVIDLRLDAEGWPHDATSLTVSIQPADAFAENDSASSPIPQGPDSDVWVIGPANRYLIGALAIMPGIKVKTFDCGKEPQAPASTGLLIYDRCAPRHAIEAPAWFIAPPDHGTPFTTAVRQAQPAFVEWSATHPILDGVHLRTVHAAEAQILTSELAVAPLAATAQGAVWVVTTESQPPMMAFGVDLTRSDIPLSAAFVPLVMNAVLWAREGRIEPPAQGVSSSETLAANPALPSLALSKEFKPVSNAGGERAYGPLGPGAWSVQTPGGTTPLAVLWPAMEFATSEAGASMPPSKAAETVPAPEAWLAGWLVPLLLLGAAATLLVEAKVDPT